MNQEYAWSRRMLAPAAVTAANVVMGFLSILAASEGRFHLSVYLLVVAVLLDMTDGRLARKLGATSKLGQELDSFSDAISFGLAPAFLVQRALLQPLGGLGVGVAATYLLAAIVRLARFNLVTSAHGKERRTLGVPTPIGAAYLMALVLIPEALPSRVAASIILVLALMMVTRLRLPDFVGRGMVGWSLLIGLANYLVFVARPNWITFGWWNLWNAVILAAGWWEDHRPALTPAEGD